MEDPDESSGIQNADKQEETDGQIRFTDVGPHSVRLEWGDPDVTANAHQKFQIECKNEETDFTKTTDANHFEIKQLSPGTTYNITVVAIEENCKKSFSASVCTAIPAPESFEYISEDATTVRLNWTSPQKIDPSFYKFQVIMYKNGEKTESVTVKSNVNTIIMIDLLPATEYKATINTKLNNDRESEPAVLIIHTKPLPPENLQIKNKATSVDLKWTDPITDEEIKHRFRVIWSSKAHSMESFTEKAEVSVLHLKPGTEYSFSVYTLVELNGTIHESTPVKAMHFTNINLESVLRELGLQNHLKNKLTLTSVLELRKPSDEGQTANSFISLPWLFLRKLMMVNSSARLTKCDSNCNSGYYKDQQAINPLDLITALFHCADPFLQQEMALKMSMCQFSLPFLLPNYDTNECTLMLWALRDITKQFRSHSLEEDSLEENSIVRTDLPLISFVRLGNNSMSKSEFLNKLLSNNQQNHNTFVYKGLENGDIHRKISNGLVEISWYLPSGKETIDKFKEPVAIANLRGDISMFRVQFDFLNQTSSAVFLFCDNLDSNRAFLDSLQIKSKLVLVCTTDSSTSGDNLTQILSHIKLKPYSKILRDENMNEAKFVHTLQKEVVDILADSTKVSIEKMSDIASNLGILVDENNTICQKAKKRADLITQGITNIPDYKSKELPLQEIPWKEISKLEKEMCRLKKANKQNIEHYKSELKSQTQKLRMQQESSIIRETVYQFISGLSSSSNEQLYFLKWMKINLDNLTRKHLSRLDEEYQELCKNPTEVKERLTDLENQIASSSLGVQHFLRELSQLYESAQFQKNKKTYTVLKKLPETCAQLMLTGFPLELVDGEASNIPLTWIRDVLVALNKLTKPHNRIKVITVLGVQSSGKSTLLNTMFGVQFAVSSGRCTRGAFMILIGVSEEFRAELQCDFLLVIDTEGLKSPELAKLADSYEHDNELATLVVGLSDITIVNIAMENATEMKDTLQIVVHAFLRMKEVGKRPCCHFVHQNTADVAVRENTLKQKKILLQHLDAMTQAAARMEKIGSKKNFTDILEYDIDKNNWYIPGLWLGTPPMAPVNTGYSGEVSKLKEGILDIFKAAKVTAQDFMTFEEWIRSLWKAVQFENFIFSFRNSLVAEAYSKLCAEFNTWEWVFKKHMIGWYTKSETKITNLGVMSVRSRNVLNVDKVMADLKHEAANELNKEEESLLGKIQQYFDSSEEHVHFVENYKEDFVNSARCLRRETETDLRNKLENAVLIQKGIVKVELIKQNQRDTMKEKVLHLISVCRNTKNKLSEHQLNEEFENMWDETVKQYSLTALPRYDLGKETYRLLHNNLETKGGAVREMLSNITSLDQCGTGPFYATTVKMNIFKKFRNSIMPGQRNKKHKLIQLTCDRIINESKMFILSKTSAKSDYNSADIQELLCVIDKNLESCIDPQISPEIEASLKVHICGNAARAFQKMHDDYIENTDPLKSLERFKKQWLADFKDLYYQRDQCQNKAESCAMQCFAPSVMEYIQKRLGPDIVDEMLTGEKGIDFSTRTFFQFSLLKQLLQDEDFDNIFEYVGNYEKFVTDWISEKIIEHFSKGDAFVKLEMKHLNTIVSKLKTAIESANRMTDSSCNFVTKVFTCLDEELVTPIDTLSATLFFNNSDPVEFADCLKSSVDKMHQALANQLRAESDTRAKLSNLSVNRPQEVLFSRVFGCGKMCPFCWAPCEAGGKGHTEHFASVHRPQGIGKYTWVKSNKLVADICSCLVANNGIFRSKATGHEWQPNKEYRQFYPDWRIQPDTSIEATDFWKYIFAKYNTQFAERYNAEPADIPFDWYYISVHQANKCLDDTFLLNSHKNKDDDPFL